MPLAERIQILPGRYGAVTAEFSTLVVLETVPEKLVLNGRAGC